MISNKLFFSILFRYVLIAVAGIGNLFLFYRVFTFPTIHLPAIILSTINETSIVGSSIVFGNSVLEIANACVAGSAYYLLFIFGMAIPSKLSKRLLVIAYCFLTFFLVNVLRIVLMALILNSSFFNEVHLFLWHIFSTVFLLFIWFSAVKIFKINEIPFYTDFLTIKDTHKTKNRKKNY